MASVSKISVYMYFDYVEYLRDVLANLQAENGASLRSIQNDLDVKGSAFFSRILDGSRPLSLANAETLARSFSLGESESEYFMNMVRFGNEKNVDKRDLLLKKLLSARSENVEYALKDSALKFFGKWYIPVIRDLLPLLPRGGDTCDVAKKIGRMMVPALKGSQVQGAIDYLIQNGFVRIDENGCYKVSDPVISTPPRVRSTFLRKYHLKNLEIDRDVFDELSSDDRSLSSVTCSMSKETFEKVRLEIQQFRQKILAMAQEDRNPDRVCHLGIQFMPRAVVKNSHNGGENEVA